MFAVVITPSPPHGPPSLLGPLRARPAAGVAVLCAEGAALCQFTQDLVRRASSRANEVEGAPLRKLTLQMLCVHAVRPSRKPTSPNKRTLHKEREREREREETERVSMCACNGMVAGRLGDSCCRVWC